jgi:alpha-1,3-mannosylglycoprotein beta-1,4-N-acetylglucosaminyltransferase C
MQRVLWRAKQVIDFSFLFSYAYPLGDYYLVVEDDVLASEQYITAIREFIVSRKEKRWIALQFTGFLGIGLLFRTKDLPKLNQLLWMFYQDQPVDMLMREFISIQIPETNVIVRRIPSLFQHIGVKSSLPNKVQKLTDNTFNMANRKFKHRNNPPADLVTSMKVYNDFFPEYAYRSTPGFFWGIAKHNDTLDIVFPNPLNISRIVIISGIIEPKKKIKDPIKDGVVEVGSKFNKVSNNNVAYCDNFIPLRQFKDGDVDYNSNITNVQCIRVRIGPGQKSWVIIREIQVFP